MSVTDAESQKKSSGRGQVAFFALLVGLIIGIMLMIVWAGNPLSSSNEVRYMDITVGSVDEQNALCWSNDPNDRDASRECAILALDPQAPTPEAGEDVSIGVVDIAPPGEDSRRQVVYVGPPQDPSVDTEPTN